MIKTSTVLIYILTSSSPVAIESEYALHTIQSIDLVHGTCIHTLYFYLVGANLIARSYDTLSFLGPTE